MRPPPQTKDYPLPKQKQHIHPPTPRAGTQLTPVYLRNASSPKNPQSIPGVLASLSVHIFCWWGIPFVDGDGCRRVPHSFSELFFFMGVGGGVMVVWEPFEGICFPNMFQHWSSYINVLFYRDLLIKKELALAIRKCSTDRGLGRVPPGL